MSNVICKYCERPITWADQKHAFGNFVRNGYDKEVLKPIFPSHIKCAKQFMKENGIGKIPVKNVVK